MHHLKDVIHQLAIESGEIINEPLMDEEPVFTDEDIAYMTEARVGEIQRVIHFSESLEALGIRYRDSDLSETSFEHYHFAVSALIHSIGVDVPVETFAVSFEDAQSDKKSFGEKAKAVGKAILQWIRDALAKLKGWFSRNKTTAAKNADEIKKKADKASADVKAARAANVKTYPVKETEKPQPTASTEPAPVAKTGTVERATVKDGATRPSTPAYLLKDGKLDTVKIRKFLADVGALNIGNIATAAMTGIENGSGSDGEDNVFTQWFKAHVGPLHRPIGRADIADNGVSLDDLETLLALVKTDADRILKAANDGNFALSKLEDAEREMAKPDSTLSPGEKEKLSKLLGMARDSQIFQSNLWSALNGLVNDLGRLAAKIKQDAQ